MRYSDVEILKDKYGRRYYKGVKYPRIYPEDSDVYIITSYGDSLDVISYDYYNTVEDYWIIAIANNLPGDTRFVEPGTQLRIPSNISRIKEDFKKINNIK